MSRQAIAAVLARTDLASGERLVALSLASFAGRENRAWPGAPAASARAGLSRSRYQQAREQLVARGLLAVDERATGRGRASTVTLAVRRHRSVVGRRHQRRALRGGPDLQPGPRARAAAPGDDGCGRGRATARCATCRPSSSALRRASRTGPTGARGLRCSRRASSSWSAAPAAAGTRTCGRCAIRARSATLLAAADATARGAAGGRASTRRVGHAHPVPRLRLRNRRRRRSKRAARIGHLPLGNSPILTGVSEPKGGQDRTVRAEKCPVLTGVSDAKGGQDQTLFELAPIETPAQTPAKTPAETPAPNARAGREPLNPRIREDPPNPPEGGSSPGLDRRRGDLRHRSRPHAPSSGPDRPRRGSPRPRAARRSVIAATGTRSASASASSSATACSRSGSSRSS